MAWWNPVWIYDSVVAVFMMILLGYILWKHHPKQISAFVGYRTSYSTKTLDTWNFAHEYCGSLLWKTGWILELVAVMINLPIYGSWDGYVLVLRKILPYIQLVLFFLAVLLTEIALRKNFTKDGVRR